MKRALLVAVLLAAAALSACTSSAPSEVVLWATIERLADLPLMDDGELPQYYEHPLAPDTEEEIVVRLDDGATLTVPNVGQHRYEAGQRVRIVVGSHGAFVL
ncbi:MAG TPA: hypothetical protein VGJ74_00400 [Burkholderiales bacterium]|jgi:outer membrane lipoprotein SlyB